MIIAIMACRPYLICQASRKELAQGEELVSSLKAALHAKEVGKLLIFIIGSF